MSNQGTSSSSRLLMVGAVVLLLGVILVLLALRDDPGAGPSSSPTPTATPTAATTPSEQPTQRPSLVTPEQAGAARVGDLAFDAGLEATAVRVSFMRGVAALPLPGDRVNLWLLAEPDDAAAGDPGVDPLTGEPLPAAEALLGDVEVLAVTGPLPAANDGTLTVVLAVPAADVPAVIGAANRSEVWITLLPNPDLAPSGATNGGDQ